MVHYVILTKYDTFTHFADLQSELLKSSKTEQESLLQKLQTAEKRCKESEVSVIRFLFFSAKTVFVTLLTKS